jgi:UDPglucose 6-dehydrogenase
VQVRAFDPVVRSVPPDFQDKIRIVESPVSLAEGADALVLVTDWPEFADIDLPRLGDSMRTPILLDGRTFLDPQSVRSAGFVYVAVGRGSTGTERSASWPSQIHEEIREDQVTIIVRGG